MKTRNKKWVKILIIIVVTISCIVGGGYLYIQSLIAEVKGTLTSCKLENENFKTVIDFEYVNNWIVVKAKVGNSKKEYDFIFDTGAQTVFSDSLLKELNINDYKKVDFSSDTSKNAFKDELVSIHKFQVGNVKFSDVGALIVDNAQYGMLNCVSPYGIIGYNLLQNCNFQIDYIKKQITITDKIDYLDNLEQTQWINYTPLYKYSTQFQETPVIPAVINDNIEVNLVFDTGNSGGINLFSETLYETITQKYPEQVAKYTFKPTITITNTKDTAHYEGAKFKTSTISVGTDLSKDLIVTIDNEPDRGYSGLIGNKYFENYIVTIDYTNKRIGFMPNKKAEKPDTKSNFGLNYTPFNNKLYVTRLYHNSEAKQKGICVGDEIVSINGIKMADLPADAFCKMYRSELILTNSEDNLLVLGIEKEGEITEYKLTGFQLF